MNITQQLWSAKEWARVQASGSELVQLVHNATNEDKWGPTGQQMEEICRAFAQGSVEIMNELRWRLKNRDKSWRACYKSLLVLDYLARNAGDAYLPEICSLVPTLRTIAQSFYYTNPKGVDHGVSVRERAKNLADLMSDGLLLREERAKALQTKRKLAHNASDGGGPLMYGGGADVYPYNRYAGYGGGGNNSNHYSNSSGSPSNSYSGGDGGSYHGHGRPHSPHTSYDPYRPARPHTNTGGSGGGGGATAIPRSREEQERLDMEVAMRLQREEERRAGISSNDVAEMYAREAEQQRRRRGGSAGGERERDDGRGHGRREAAQHARGSSGHDDGAANTDEALAMRLQREEEQRARREGRSLPTLRSDHDGATTPPPASAAAKKRDGNSGSGENNAAKTTSQSSEPQQQQSQQATSGARANVLDDLFAPTVATAPAPSLQSSMTMPTAPTAGGDPFDAFLDRRTAVQQQQQQQQPPQMSGYAANAFAAMPAPPPQQQQQQQPMMYGTGMPPAGQPPQAQGNTAWAAWTSPAASAPSPQSLAGTVSMAYVPAPAATTAATVTAPTGFAPAAPFAHATAPPAPADDFFGAAVAAPAPSSAQAQGQQQQQQGSADPWSQPLTGAGATANMWASLDKFSNHH